MMIVNAIVFTVAEFGYCPNSHENVFIHFVKDPKLIVDYFTDSLYDDLMKHVLNVNQ